MLLYQFARGLTTWNYVAAPESMARAGRTWTPEAITSSPIAQTGDVPKDQVELKLPRTNTVAASFLSYAPDVVTAVAIYRTNFDNTDTVAIWLGRVAHSQLSVSIVTLACEPVFTSIRRLGLQATYQRLCRHRFFGPGCNVNPATYAQTLTVTAVAGSVITITGLSTNFVGGTLKAPDGTIFFIIDQNSTTVTLMRQSAILASSMVSNPGGFTVTLYPGCDHSTGACTGYSNIGNFGGFPGIPRINPYSNMSNIF